MELLKFGLNISKDTKMSKHSKKKKHHVKSHHWYDGILKTIEHTFDSLEEAMLHVKKNVASHTKVYDENKNLVHAETPAPIPSSNTYA